MAKNVLAERMISRLSRDFKSLKRELIKMTQAHHTGAFNDFNESAPGMALLDHAAFVGDVLGFNLDMNFNELVRDRAQQMENVVAIAKSQGYRPAGKRAARGEVTYMLEVPAIANSRGEIVPDDTYTPSLRAGAQAGGPDGTIFESLENVHFSASLGRSVTGSRFDSATGLPTHFALAKPVPVIAGETREETFVITEFKPFRQIELSEPDVIEVISIVDSDGNFWREVDYLAEDTVFDSTANLDSDNDVVPFVMKLSAAPRRFVTDRDPSTSKTSCIFGSGDGLNFDDELVPNLADLALPLNGRQTFTSFALDPQNFLKTKSLGLSPFGTTLTVRYRVGGGTRTNVPPMSIKNVLKAELDFASTTTPASIRAAVEGSIECRNLKKTDGGGAEESIAEIKANSAAFFASQQRIVTREDYIARVFTLPAKFGKPEKVYVKRDASGALAMDVHTLAIDPNGHLCRASATLKKNIGTYLSKFRMATDGINILDSEIINLRCSFGIVTAAENRTQVVLKCLDVVSAHLDTARMQIGQPIIVSELSSLMQKVEGVISVYDLRFSNMVGVSDGFLYSSTRFDVDGNIRNGILHCPENCVFEVKYPRRNIVGAAR